MTVQGDDGVFEIKPCPLIGQFNIQRFPQFSPEDTANWYIVKGQDTKRPYSMYPTMGRAHINYAGANRLIFGSQPRSEFKSIKYSYYVVGNLIYRVDSEYNQIVISGNSVVTFSGQMYFAYLVVNSLVFACFTDQEKIYIYQEDTGVPCNTGAFYVVTDPNAPGNVMVNNMPTFPGYIMAFGNRIAVSCLNSSQFFLSEINLLTANTGSASFQPNYCFTVGTVLNGSSVVTQGAAVFAQEDGIIKQMGVLNNTAYIFCDFVTGIWSNTPAVFSGTGVSFPWKKNTTYNWNFGIASSNSLDINFGMIVLLAQNSEGLIQFMKSTGGQPEKIPGKGVDVLLQNYTNNFGALNPFLGPSANGFLYQYENVVFYRISGGPYTGTQILDQEQQANSIEHNFEVGEWHRCIELNGERCRIQGHIYFNSKHLVTVLGEGTIYEMSGKYYYNEIVNPNEPNLQAPDAYIAYPFRYERVSTIISEDDLSEFETNYVEVDFVFGDSNINYSTAPFTNAVFLIAETLLNGQPQFIISETPDGDGNPVYVLSDPSNTPSIDELTYNTLYKPSVELWYSDDGGISFQTSDVLVFSNIGVYIWKMRWYQLGCSRNRVYKLVAVSPVPIVILGATMFVRRVSGGAN